MIKVAKDTSPGGDKLVSVTAETKEEAMAVIHVVIEHGMLFDREQNVFTLNKLDLIKLKKYLPKSTQFINL